MSDFEKDGAAGDQSVNQTRSDEPAIESPRDDRSSEAADQESPDTVEAPRREEMDENPDADEVPRQEGLSPEYARLADRVLRAKQGDAVAFGALYEEFNATVVSIALGIIKDRDETDELAQDIWVHVLHKLNQLRDPARFAGWLKQVTFRMSINHLLRTRRGVGLTDGISCGLCGGQNPLEAVLVGERGRILRACLSLLKPKDREVLDGHYFQHKSIEQLAGELDAPIGTVKRRLHVARSRLREQLQAVYSGGLCCE